MNKINRKVEYALIGLKHMRAKQPGELTSVKELVLHYGCPFEVTSKVMQLLASRGIVRSEQGAHGGYQLVKDLNRITLYEIMEIIVGPVEIARCLHEEQGSCEIRDTCNVVSPITALNRRLTEFYRGLTVGELLDNRGPSRLSAEPRAQAGPYAAADAVGANAGANVAAGKMAGVES